MCGRFQFAPKGKAFWKEDFGFAENPDFMNSINLAPSQIVPVIVAGDQGLHFQPMKWGLSPAWKSGSQLTQGYINARVETAMQKISFRSAWHSRRCLILSTGYYEWAQKGGPPILLESESMKPFCFAGLWEPSFNDGSESISTCAILTTEAASEIQDLHPRMPVMLQPDAAEGWLLDGVPGLAWNVPARLPFPLSLRPVSKGLNKVGAEDPGLLFADPTMPTLFDLG